MPLVYKFDVLKELKRKGYSSSDLRKHGFLSESVIQHLRDGRQVSWNTIEQVCAMLDCQPGDLLEFIDGDAAMRKLPRVRTRHEEMVYFGQLYNDKYTDKYDSFSKFYLSDERKAMSIPDDWVSP